MPTFGSAQQQCKKRKNGKFEGRIFRLGMILLDGVLENKLTSSSSIKVVQGKNRKNGF